VLQWDVYIYGQRIYASRPLVIEEDDVERYSDPACQSQHSARHTQSQYVQRVSEMQ
jgi:hypothetical protein